MEKDSIAYTNSLAVMIVAENECILTHAIKADWLTTQSYRLEDSHSRKMIIAVEAS